MLISEDVKELKENRKPLSTEALANITDTIESVVKGNGKTDNHENNSIRNSLDTANKCKLHIGLVAILFGASVIL